MAIEQPTIKKLESYTELGEVKRKLKEIERKAVFIEGKDDVHELLKEIKECHELCHYSNDEKLKNSEIRETMQNLVENIMSELHHFDQADAQGVREAKEKIEELKQKISEEIEKVNELLFGREEEEEITQEAA